jgi:hypothetical protein
MASLAEMLCVHCIRILWALVNPKTPTQAYQAGRRAAENHPPRVIPIVAGVAMVGRPLGLNPCDLWTREYDEWNRGYLEGAALREGRGEVSSLGGDYRAG